MIFVKSKRLHYYTVNTITLTYCCLIQAEEGRKDTHVVKIFEEIDQPDQDYKQGQISKAFAKSYRVRR